MTHGRARVDRDRWRPLWSQRCERVGVAWCQDAPSRDRLPLARTGLRALIYGPAPRWQGNFKPHTKEPDAVIYSASR